MVGAQRRCADAPHQCAPDSSRANAATSSADARNCSIGFGVAYLALICNSLSATLAAITIVIYIFAYPPLKRASTANTAVGAVPGAIPPMIGWAAARGTLDAGAWSLFAIVFLWQLPHFFAIAWMCRDD